MLRRGWKPVGPFDESYFVSFATLDGYRRPAGDLSCRRRPHLGEASRLGRPWDAQRRSRNTGTIRSLAPSCLFDPRPAKFRRCCCPASALPRNKSCSRSVRSRD
jgi:hypothetical protein